MKIVNANYESNTFLPNHLFVCALGYETRSFHLLSKAYTRINRENILAFTFDELIKARDDGKNIDDICSAYDGIEFTKANYNDFSSAVKVIINFINEKKRTVSPLIIHIDYSSMPRSWYCCLPERLSMLLGSDDMALFWYVDGEYPDSYINYPSAGIHSFVYYSGKPTLRTNKKRLHIISLNYDVVRTQATISLLDPDSFLACVAYDSRNETIQSNVIEINHSIISHANMLISLRMDDFEFMIAKLCEIANEYVSEGDIIFVPDGPKPLIFAESLIPLVLDKKGISCLHIKRNTRYFNPVEVLPTENIIGFMINNS